MLLILAGVTIAMLSGDNSAPQKATEAAQKDAIAGAKDEIAMEVQEALLNYYNNTYVEGDGTSENNIQKVVADAAYDAVDNAKKRNNQLLDSSKVEENTITLNTKSYTVTGKIDTNGGIIWSDTVASTGGTGETLTNAEKKEKINDAIGQTVDYGKDITNYSGGWRVFYTSESEMFLISTNVISFNGIPITDYTNSDDVFNPRSGNGTNYSYSDVTYGADYNSKWQKKLVEANTTDNESRSKATAYLCDPKNWTEYISPTAPKGTYAVGGPTKELFLLSWNESYKNGKLEGETEEQVLTDNDVSTGGYANNKPQHLYDDDPITKEMLDGLYNPGTTYWLASPGSSDAGSVCLVSSRGCVGSGRYDNDFGVRPIVSIPISNVQIEENGTVKIE